MNHAPKTQRPLKVPKPAGKRKRFPWWTVPVIVLCLCLLAAAWVFADEQIANYEKFSDMRAAVSGDTFFGPVHIDGVALSGLTMEQAKAALDMRRTAQEGSFEIFLSADDRTWRISSDEVPMEWNTDLLLEKAYMIGRVGSLEQRYRQVTGIETPVDLQSEFTYDKTAVRELTDKVAALLTVEGRDASVIAFDVASRTFALSDEQFGRSVDANQLYQTVIDQLDAKQYGTTIFVEMETVTPAVTRAELERDYGLIASFTTGTTSNENRNNNIRLAAEAFNGVRIEPGDTISFNETTGQRTREKGYKEAGAIENGRTVQEVGGGVCQVSSTLFNALLRADAEIVTRKPHAWPSDYVPRGEDATVDWPNLDLVMRNTSDVPMFIAAWYQDRKVTVEVYGLSLGNGLSIDLQSETTYSKTPTEPIYTYNAGLPIGTTQKVKEARTGYSVQTYKVWYQNGQEVSREKLYTSEYRVIYEEYEYNDGNPP